jgi:hypothetical protein
MEIFIHIWILTIPALKYKLLGGGMSLPRGCTLTHMEMPHTPPPPGTISNEDVIIIILIQ